MIHHMKGLASEVYLHLLPNDCIEVKRLLVFLAPLGVVLTELPVRIEFEISVPALLDIPIPEHLESHVLPGRHVLLNRRIVRLFEAKIPPSRGWIFSVHRLGDAVVRDSLRERVAEFVTGFERPQEIVHARGADVERLGDCHTAHSQCIVFCNDVFIV